MVMQMHKRKSGQIYTRLIIATTPLGKEVGWALGNEGGFLPLEFSFTMRMYSLCYLCK